MSGPLDMGQKLLSVFDAIFVINLAHRTDRRGDMAGQLARLGLGFDHPAVHLFTAQRPKDKGAFPTVGTRGCFQSHMGVLAAFLSTAGNRCLVLEDDADFVCDFETVAAPVVDHLKGQEWDMFYGYPARGMPVAQNAVAKLPAPMPHLRLHCYGMSRRGALLALPILQAIYDRPAGHPDGGAMHVDGAYNWVRRRAPNFTTLAAMTPLAVQRPSRTDIHDLPWYDRLPLARESVAQLRRLKRAI